MTTTKSFREKRKERGFTQAQLAKAVGVSLTTIQTWENEVGKPTEENQRKLDEVLGR